MTENPLPSPGPSSFAATSPPLSPPKEETKSWIDGIPHNWLKLAPEHGNCDQLPDRLTPGAGCPECGSAWTEVRSVAYARDCHRGEFLEATWHVQQIGGIEPVMAVRLGCYDGHVVEYDGVRFKVVPAVPTWAIMGIGVLGVVAAMYSSAWALKK